MTYKKIKAFARLLRKNETPAEVFFWNKVRNRQFLNLKFNRQHVIQYADVMNKKYFFIPDFYCAEKRVIVELDGAIHQDQLEYDQIRTEVLEEMRYHIIRFTNEAVLQDWRCVKMQLTEFIQDI